MLPLQLPNAIKTVIHNNIPSFGLVKTVSAALVAHGHSILVGLCQGYSAVLLPQLTADHSDLGDISSEQASWIAALGVISNPVGALLGGMLAEALGRKTTLLAAAVPYLTGWLLIGFAPDLQWLGAGRFVTGLAVGMGTVSYVYVAEVAGASQRGALAACGPVLVSLGVLMVYALGAVMPWRTVAFLASGGALLAGLAVLFLPESPPWLAVRGRHREAERALSWLRHVSPETARLELERMQNDKATSDDDVSDTSCSKTLKSILQPTVWKPFFLLLAFFIFQEGSGIYVILFYAVDFFREVGTSVDEFMASISVGVARLVMSIVGAVLLGRFGRRTLAMASAIGMTVAMSVTSTYEFIFANVPTHIRPFAWLPAICILIHVCVSMVGMLQLPWIMTSELFPLKVRSLACGFVTAAAHLFIFASVKTYPALSALLGMSGTLIFFASASFGGAIFAYTLLPETKGKTLMEIEYDFRNSNRKKKNFIPNSTVYTIEKDQTLQENKNNFNSV